MLFGKDEKQELSFRNKRDLEAKLLPWQHHMLHLVRLVVELSIAPSIVCQSLRFLSQTKMNAYTLFFIRTKMWY